MSKTYNIAGYKYTIEEVDEREMNDIYFEHTGKEIESGRLGGLTLPSLRYICVGNYYFLEERKEILRHELTHAFIASTQITSQENDWKYSEEMVCEFVAKYGKKINEICDKVYPPKKKADKTSSD